MQENGRILLKKNSIGADTVRLTASKTITLCITMVTSMMLSRFRTLEEYGTYSQLLLVVSLSSSIFMLGLPNSINYFLARAESQKERKKFLSVYYTLSTILGLIMGFVLACAIPLFEGYFNNPNMDNFLYFFALYPWASVVSSSIENVLVVYQKTQLLMIYRFLNSICLMGAVLFVQWLDFGFPVYMLCYVLIYVIFSIAVYVIVWILCGGLSFILDKIMLKEVFKFSLPIGLATVVGTLDVEIDKLLIGWMMNTEQLAIYTNASKELPVTIIAASITAVLLPHLSVLLKDNKKIKAIRLWGYAIELSFIFICLIVSGVFTYAKDVLILLYSEKYLPGLNVFRIYTLVLILRCTYFGMILNACGETKKLFYCSAIALLLNAILNPIFYQLMGINGPAIATLVSLLCIMLLQLKLTAKYAQMTIREVIPWKFIGSIAVINIVMSVLFSFIKKVLPFEHYFGSISESILLGFVWCGIYFIGMRKTIIQIWNRLNGAGEQ